MSDELNDAARGLIASARRSARTLEPGRRARVRLAVLGTVGGSSLATAASLSVTKLVIVAALSAAVGSGATLMIVRNTGWMVRKGEKTTPAVPRAAPSPAAPPADPVPPSLVARPVVVQAPPPVAVAPRKASAVREAPVVRDAVVAPEPMAEPAPETPELAPAPQPSTPPPPTSAARLAQELELLHQALEATKMKQWAQAQRVLDEHARQFTPAALEVEARAMQVMVWCGEGRSEEARALARELERSEPLNPAVQRLRGTCARTAGSVEP